MDRNTAGGVTLVILQLCAIIAALALHIDWPTFGLIASAILWGPFLVLAVLFCLIAILRAFDWIKRHIHS